MSEAQKNGPLQPQNATTGAASGHTFSECFTAPRLAPAEQLGAAEESPPLQRIVEIRTPINLTLTSRPKE